MKFRNRNLELGMDSRESLQRPDSRLSLRGTDSRLSLRGPQGTKQSLAAFLSLVCTLSSFVLFTACSDFGERDNPLDPGAYNYVAPNDDAKSSSSSIKKTESSSSSVKSDKSSSSVEKSKSSSSVKSDSAASSSSSSVKTQPSSSSKNKEQSSSSKVPEPAEGSSSSVKPNSVAASSSSSVKTQPSSSSKVPEPAEGSSSSIKPNSVAASSSSSVKTQPSSSSKKASSSSEAVIPASSGDLRSSSSSKKQDQSSSSKVPEPAEGSSSSVEPNSVAASSSSIVTQPPSSSSVQPPQSSSEESSWTCGVSTITRGDYEYKTVVIKEQCWTKENLRYVPSVGTTMCYGNKAENCETYGLLYDFEAANLACPTGWRLPTSAEYEALAEYSMEGAPLYDAGAHFKATSGWTPENGDDFLEFTALPGGKCNEDQTCQNIGKMGYWWTSTEKVKNTSHFALALNGDGDSYSATNKMDNDQYISVRCVKK